MIQEILTHIVAAAALLYLVHWLVVNFRSTNADESRCSSCPSCESDSAEEQKFTAVSETMSK